MEKDSYRYSAGLVFLEEAHAEEAQLSAALQSVLEARGQRIQSVNVLENDLMRIHTDTMILDLTPPLHPDSQQTMMDGDEGDAMLPHTEMLIGLSLALRNDVEPEETDPAAIERRLKSYLAEMTTRLAKMTQPDFVLWLRPSALLETDEFIDAASHIMPRKVRRSAENVKSRHTRPNPVLLSRTTARVAGAACGAANRFPEIRTASRSLETEYERRTHVSDTQVDAAGLRSAIYPPTEQSTAQDNSFAMRMASWVLVTTVGMFFLPMAVVLTFANMVRGEDFRLAAHTMALTGMMMALNASGALAQTMNIIGL